MPDMFDIFVVKFVCESARYEVGVEFESELEDSVVADSIGFQGLDIVSQRFVGEFDDLVLRMDLGDLENPVLEDTKSVAKINIHSVLIQTLHYANLRYLC